jgi:hypothetical protein
VELTCNTSALQYFSATAGSVHTLYGGGALGFHPTLINGSMIQQWSNTSQGMNGWIGQLLGDVYDANNFTEIEIASNMGELDSNQFDGNASDNVSELQGCGASR